MRKNRNKIKKSVGILGPCLTAVLSIWILGLCVAGISGCSTPPAPEADDFIIRAGLVSVSPETFEDELDLKLAAYPYDVKNRAEDYNSMVLDLVTTLSDETMLLAAARDKGVGVTADEVALAEAEFKQDYPEDSFDQMLLENAIPYTVWKHRLEKDMVISKLVQQELIAAQEISPDDMIAFYDRYKSRPGNAADAPGNIDEAALVEQLRMEKSQASYEDWITGLKGLYPVEINKKAVSGFLMNQN